MTSWIAYVGLSAVLVAVANIIRKHVLDQEHALEQLAAEAPFRLLVIACFIPFITIPPLWQMLLILLAAGVLMGALYYRNRAFRHLPISVASPMQNLSPIFLLALAIPLLGERPSLGQLGGVLLIMLGGYALEARSNDLLAPLRKAVSHKYTTLLVMMLFMLSAIALIDKTMLSRVGIQALTYLFWMHLFIAFFSLVSHIILYRGDGLIQDIRTQGGWLAGISILSMTSILAFFTGIAQPEALIVLAIPIRRTATLIETIGGGALFHEDGVWRKAVGCAIMVGGVALIA